VGNPSDGYGGAVLATTLRNFRASVEAERSAALSIDPPSTLVTAGVRGFARTLEPAAAQATVRWQQAIPREVGLGSSSALVIATLRALASLFELSLSADQLATLAHTIERQDLGIAGGRQDQVVQSQEGLLLMEFGERPVTDAVDVELLPPLLIAYRRETAQASGPVHAPLRARFEAREALLLEAMHELARLARDARDALVGRDHERFGRCVNATFEIRARIMALDPSHAAMVRAARDCGASTNYTGSGGAIVCVCADELHRRECERALRALGCRTLVPELG